MQDDVDTAISRRGRITALVIVAGGVAALLAPWLVFVLGLPMRYEMLFYFAAMAAFVWALVNIYQIRRLRRDNQG
ncbi:DUF5337 domain-containing protein [Pukyongiella litopenaei]|uniref:Uncharacterized protein n=1 Tax=Pukyongiella litopenaei TaxID=2605946 RepID=A0A2S0MMV9_9RHOB|nr:DUF5337 domain-containing protein [Pukyongiella litopenaei]AVO37210.1 hypothetical protein C6Y53_05465 [Pukyongiella litopenaei]